MSTTRRIKRTQKRQSDKHMAVFSSLVEQFYLFMEQNPQPSNEAVRKNFKDLNHRWKAYCYKNELTKEARILFEQEISIVWERKKSETSKKEA